jgi:hypothetical protein
MEKILILFDENKPIENIYINNLLDNIFITLSNNYNCELNNIYIYNIINHLDNINYIINYEIYDYKYIIKLPLKYYIFNNISDLLDNNIYTNNDNEYLIIPHIYFNHYNDIILYNFKKNTNNIKYKKFLTKKEVNVQYNSKINNKEYLDIINKSVGFGNIQVNYIDNKLKLLYNDAINITNDLISSYNNNTVTSNSLISINSTLTKKSNKIAICVIGQIRTFMEDNTYKSFKKYIIDNLENNNIDYHIFFLVENKKTYTWQKNVNKDCFEYNIDKQKIINIIDTITHKYDIEFYNFDNIYKEIPIIDNITFVIQHYLFYKVYKDHVKSYEQTNNIKFDYIIKTRPDTIYMEPINDLLYKEDVLLQHDKLYIISNKFSCSIYISYILLLFGSLSSKLIKYISLSKNNNLLLDTDNIIRIDHHMYFYIYFFMIKKNINDIFICYLSRCVASGL